MATNTINININRKYKDNFVDRYPSIQLEVPDSRFEQQDVKKAIEEKVNDMLKVDVYRVSGRTVIEVDEDGTSYYGTFQEKFEIVIDFVEMTGVVNFKRSNRGQSRWI